MKRPPTKFTGTTRLSARGGGNESAVPTVPFRDGRTVEDRAAKVTMPVFGNRKKLAALLCVILSVAGFVRSQTTGPPKPSRGADWEAVGCGDFGIKETVAGLECGYVAAPLRHAAPDGVKIKLATVIIPSDAPDKRPDPLFMAQGGPGGSTIGSFAATLISTPDLRPVKKRDIVLWDQRGTFYSKPALICQEVNEATIQSLVGSGASANSELDAYAACGQRLKAEVGDLSAFNSAENADDVETIRRALGYEKINFYGVSYGTELGQFLMRQHPEKLRGVVLDGVVPLSYNILTEPAFAKQRIAEKYFDSCAADAACNAAFPDLRRRYLELFARLNAGPVDVDIRNPDESDRVYRIKLTGDLMESALYQSLYMDVHELVPLIIDRAEQGDYTYLVSILLPLGLFDNTSANGMWMTVACADRGDTDLRSVDYSRINRRLADAERKGAAEALQVCRVWNIETLPRESLAPLQSDLPTLLLSGDYDPITPPVYAEQLQRTLPNGRHVVFRLGSHGQAMTTPCASEVIDRFIENPAENPESPCAAAGDNRFLTEKDIVQIAGLRKSLKDRGVSGLIFFGAMNIPSLLAILILLSSVPVYLTAWAIRRIRRQKIPSETTGLTRAFSRAAPWLPVLVGVIFLAFLALFGLAVTETLKTNINLLFMGALGGRWRWIFQVPIAGSVFVLLMSVAAAALWLGRQRTVLGRVYFTFLALTGILLVLLLRGSGTFGF